MNILIIAFAPVLIISIYIYYRDKYEKEPIKMLLTAFLLGTAITLPIILVEKILDDYWHTKFETINDSVLTKAAYLSFIVAAFTEESFKYIAFFFIWRNKNFNEKFDGIVYAVFISLGFAAVENVLYVIGKGAETGILRAFTAVPTHALLGVAMGYYLGEAKFAVSKRLLFMILAIIIPIILHGFYDFILFSRNTYMLLILLPFLIYLWYSNFRRMKKHSDDSVFK